MSQNVCQRFLLLEVSIKKVGKNHSGLLSIMIICYNSIFFHLKESRLKLFPQPRSIDLSEEVLICSHVVTVLFWFQLLLMKRIPPKQPLWNFRQKDYKQSDSLCLKFGDFHFQAPANRYLRVNNEIYFSYLHACFWLFFLLGAFSSCNCCKILNDPLGVDSLSSTRFSASK